MLAGVIGEVVTVALPTPNLLIPTSYPLFSCSQYLTQSALDNALKLI